IPSGFRSRIHSGLRRMPGTQGRISPREGFSNQGEDCGSHGSPWTRYTRSFAKRGLTMRTRSHGDAVFDMIAKVAPEVRWRRALRDEGIYSSGDVGDQPLDDERLVGILRNVEIRSRKAKDDPPPSTRSSGLPDPALRGFPKTAEDSSAAPTDSAKRATF